MCSADPLGNAIAGLVINAATQALSQVNWTEVMTYMIEGDKPKPVNLRTPNDLKTWLCSACANGQIAPETLSAAMTLLIEMELAQRQGNTTAATNSIVALKRILA
jgi:hypothetical protein